MNEWTGDVRSIGVTFDADGKSYTQKEMIDKMTEEFIKNLKIPKEPKGTMSFFEVLMMCVLTHGVKKAKEAKMKTDVQIASYLTGMLSARFSLKNVELKIKKKKKSKKSEWECTL